jgi:hypothetical protein
MPPPQGQSGYSGYSGKSGFSGAGGGLSGFSGFSGHTGATGLQGPIGPQGATGPQGLPGIPGTSGPSTIGVSGYSGYSGTSAKLDGVTVTNGNITAQGSITSGGPTSGIIALSGSSSGTAHLTVENVAGSGNFKLPSTTGNHTLATLDDLAALRNELLGLV